MKEKKQKDRRSPGNSKRMRKWLGHHQEMSRTGLIGKRREVRKKSVEAGVRGGNGGANHYRVGCGRKHQSGP